jgi:hypothetical protein
MGYISQPNSRSRHCSDSMGSFVSYMASDNAYRYLHVYICHILSEDNTQ